MSSFAALFSILSGYTDTISDLHLDRRRCSSLELLRRAAGQDLPGYHIGELQLRGQRTHGHLCRDGAVLCDTGCGGSCCSESAAADVRGAVEELQ